jgi:hypothetical protein
MQMTRRPSGGLWSRPRAALAVGLVTCTVFSCAASPSRSRVTSDVATGGEAGRPQRPPDVWYEPSAPEVVRLMLDLAHVGPGDVVYDL